MNISKLFSNINLIYLIINLLTLIDLTIFLNLKNLPKNKKYLILLVAIFLSIGSFSYLNGIVNQIFKLKFLSVKTYLIILIISNLITLLTINKPVKLGYKIANYILFILLTIILGATIAIVLGNKFTTFYIMDVANAVNFIDLSLVLFMIYIIVISLIYIGYYLFSEKEELKKDIDLNIVKTKKTLQEKNSVKLKIKEKFNLIFKRKENKIKENNNHNYSRKLLTKEELLNNTSKNNFYINGVDCSIIFNDSNTDSIYQNYQILTHDLNARLVNGYTLEENKMLKNICLKLQVKTLANIDLQNPSLLNRVSIDEYNLLKKLFQ